MTIKPNVETSYTDLPGNKKVYIYGIGTAGRALYAWILKCREDITVLGFIDSFKSGFEQFEQPVYSVDIFFDNINQTTYDLLLIASSQQKNIVEKLTSYSCNNFLSIRTPIYLLENILIDPDRDRQNYIELNPHHSDSPGELHLFFGENGGRFTGNNKYYFLYLRKKLPDLTYWVSREEKDIAFLKQNQIPYIDARKDDFINWLNQAGFFYFDKMSWQRYYPWLRFFPAKKIHTSHGVGLKLTELMQVPQEFMQRLTPEERQRLYEQVMANDLLLSTSPFYEEKVSIPAYGTPKDKISLAGYPKNDVIYHFIEGEKLFTDENAIEKVEKAHQQGQKIILYTPTFRDMDACYQGDNFLNYNMINSYLASINAILVIKGHTNADQYNNSVQNLSNIIHYLNDRDLYPLFRISDLLITDYSSIYMDYLHARKPIIFFPYDWDSYTSFHRELQFDYEQMTPGPKAYNWLELQNWLNYFLIEENDQFKSKREEIFSLAYSQKKTGASERLYSDMFAMGILTD